MRGLGLLDYEGDGETRRTGDGVPGWACSAARVALDHAAEVARIECEEVAAFERRNGKRS